MLRLTLRTLLARKLRLLMSGLAVVLGVAFLAGVLVFSHGLSATFDNIVHGSTPDAVVRPQLEGVGSADAPVTQTTSTLTPDVIDALDALPEVARADGDVQALGMNLLAKDGTLVGGTGAPTLAFNHTGSPNMDGGQVLDLTSGRWPERPGEVVMDQHAVDHGDYSVGDDVKLLAPSGQLKITARLVGTAEFNGGGTAGATLLIFSTDGAQELFLDGKDVYNQISLTAADGVSQEQLAAAAQKVVPTGFEAVTGDKVAQEQEDSFGTFLSVINIFLLVFAVIAVIVGAFIIVNTFTILVAQRTRELALLRALGASRGQVTRSVLLEAFVLALVSSTLGMGLGLLLARALAGIFRGVGLDISGDVLTLTSGSVVTGYLVGIVVTVLAAFLPARRAGKVSPMAALRADAGAERRPLGRRTAIGAVVIMIGAGFAVVGIRGGPGSDALWVGIGAVLWILTVAVLSPVVGKPVLVACQAVFGRLFGTPGRLAGDNALRDPRRTGATASALMIGLALVSTIGVLAASLNASIDDSVDEQFTADFLVNAANFQPFSPSVGDRLAKVDGVGVLSRQQYAAATSHGSAVVVAGNDARFDQIYDLDVVDGTQHVSGEQAIVFDDYAKDHGLSVGDRLPLTFQGDHTLDATVVGIVKSNDITAPISVPLAELAKGGVARADTTISILLAPGADADEVHAALDKAVKPVPIVGVNDKEEFSDSIRGQVDQLLYFIYGLLAFAIIIAVFGIINTLGLSVFERTREIGLLRAIGMSRAKLRSMITLESIAIAVLGAVLGLALGLLIGVLLRQTLTDDLTTLVLPISQLVVFLVIAVVVGVLAAVVPALRAARMNVLEAIAAE
ncbi:ABC transporter permease [Nocardioides panacisoli]|uniref:FtsX-like permease family protein n=1 Tax=Nocardioides panacisoli TaxID=627624 RepID=A0ABP7J1K4_9ACTN